MIHLPKLLFLPSLDLNVECQNMDFLRSFAEGSYAPRQTRVFATHGTSAADHLSPMRGKAPRRFQSQGLLLSGSLLRHAKAAIKLHALLDLRGAIPSFIHITDGKTHEVNVQDYLLIEPGAYYLLDRGYLDFSRLHAIQMVGDSVLAY